MDHPDAPAASIKSKKKKKPETSFSHPDFPTTLDKPKKKQPKSVTSDAVPAGRASQDATAAYARSPLTSQPPPSRGKASMGSSLKASFSSFIPSSSSSKHLHQRSSSSETDVRRPIDTSKRISRESSYSSHKSLLLSGNRPQRSRAPSKESNDPYAGTFLSYEPPATDPLFPELTRSYTPESIGRQRLVPRDDSAAARLSSERPASQSRTGPLPNWVVGRAQSIEQPRTQQAQMCALGEYDGTEPQGSVVERQQRNAPGEGPGGASERGHHKMKDLYPSSLSNFEAQSASTGRLDATHIVSIPDDWTLNQPRRSPLPTSQYATSAQTSAVSDIHQKPLPKTSQRQGSASSAGTGNSTFHLPFDSLQPPRSAQDNTSIHRTSTSSIPASLTASVTARPTDSVSFHHPIPFRRWATQSSKSSQSSYRSVGDVHNEPLSHDDAPPVPQHIATPSHQPALSFEEPPALSVMDTGTSASGGMAVAPREEEQREQQNHERQISSTQPERAIVGETHKDLPKVDGPHVPDISPPISPLLSHEVSPVGSRAVSPVNEIPWQPTSFNDFSAQPRATLPMKLHSLAGLSTRTEQSLLLAGPHSDVSPLEPDEIGPGRDGNARSIDYAGRQIEAHERQKVENERRAQELERRWEATTRKTSGARGEGAHEQEDEQGWI